MRSRTRLRAWVAGSTLALLLALTPAHAGAQVLMGFLAGNLLSSKDFNIGFEIGMNFANVDDMKGAERMNQAVFGLFADWRFSEHFHLGGSVLPVSARGAEGLKPVPTGDPTFDGLTVNGTMERKLSYVDIPILLRWAPKREAGFRIGVGPQIGFRTGATDRYEAKTAAGLKFTAERDIGGTTAGVDAGISADLEYRFKVLAIGARYTYGLVDTDESAGGGTVYNRVLTGTGRIYLGKGGKKEKEPAAQ